jgi:predicted acylesterase/phospholipase RssA
MAIPVTGVRDEDLANTVGSIASGGARRALTTRHVLVLTSGGADGAFGAGALSSWTRSGRRPRFDVVSGVSTGALQAPLAFLGPDHDHLLRHFFTESRTGDIFVSNGVSGLYGVGLYSSTPLRQQLVTLFDDAMLDKIAAEHKTGRRLFVTTTDLTFGRPHVWDMGAIASSREGDRQARFVGILLASVAAPGLIEPVLLAKAGAEQAEAHGDGGINMPVPIDAFMLAGPPGRLSVTVIVNGHVSPVAATALDSQASLPLAKRAISLLLRRLMFVSVEQARILAARRRAAFSVISLPVSSPEARDPFDFNPDEMKAIFAVGADLNEKVWKDIAAKHRDQE